MKKNYLPVIVLFALVSLTVLLLKTRLQAAGIDPWVILGGNTILFIITIITMSFNNAAMQHSNTQGFMRNVYGGFMIKFFLIIIALLVYLFMAKPINKPGLIAAMGLYLFYTFFGARSVLGNKNSK